MTTISQPVLPPQAPSTVSSSIAQVQGTSSPSSGTTSPQITATSVGGPGRSYASATKKQFTSTSPQGGPVSQQAGLGSGHGRSDSVPPVNGRPNVTPAVPSLSTPTIVNGSNGMNTSSPLVDHGRKPSATISASGTSGHMPNGGPAVGKQAVGNSIQFGSINAGGPSAIVHSQPHYNQTSNSLAVSAPGNPRITSPQHSPSPIPQPPASGGRPPSSLQGQGNGLSFGSLGGDDPSRQLRPGMPSGSLTPGLQAAHLRRESSQSGHSEMSIGAMGPNNGRGGFQQPGGRGRSFNPQYSQQVPYSPNAPFRPMPNQPRNGQNIPQYQQQGRPLAQQYPHSPHQAARSPAMTSAAPIHPQTGQMPLQSPQQMGHPQYGYGQMSLPQNQYGIPGFDPNYGYYNHPYTMHPGITYMPAPPSPRQPYQHPAQAQAYTPGLYNNQHQPPTMSRTSSAVSDRPASSLGPPQTPITPAPSHTVTASRGASSPAPKSSNFQIPARKSAGIVIKDPNSGVVKKFDKQVPSPAPPSKSPAIISSTPTPPPQTTSHTDSQHNRTESKSVKTDEEKRNDMRDAIAKKIEADKEEERRLKDEAQAKALKEKEEAEAKLLKEQQEVEAREAREAQEKAEAEAVAAKEKVEAEAAAKAKAEAEAREKQEHEAREKEEQRAREEQEQKDREAQELKTREEQEQKAREEQEQKAREEQEQKAREEQEQKAQEKSEQTTAQQVEPTVTEETEDEYWARIEAEEERKEREAEEAYQRKRAVQKEEEARRKAEEAVQTDEDMKKAEREAEAAEEARIKKLEESEGDDSKERGKLFADLKKDDPLSLSRSAAGQAAAETPAESGTATPVSETSSMGPPAKGASVGKKVPTALKIETSKPVEAPQPSAALQSLRSARFLTTINDVTYPSAIASPNPALNTAAPMGKFRYDKNFLMQFQGVFVEKPSETWAERVKETVGDTSETPASARSATRGGGMMTSRQPSNRASVLPGGAFGGGAFGQFQGAGGRTLPPGTTSESRYQAATQAQGGRTMPLRYNSNTPGGFPMGFAQPMSRTTSGPSGSHPQSPRNPSSRGTGGRGSKSGKSHRENDKDAKSMPLTAGLDLKPIQVTSTGWKPLSLGPSSGMAGPPPGGDGYLAPDVVQRKVKAALNKMTPSTFEKITGQILDIVAQSKKETDGRTLRQVIQLTFEKATDEAHWAEMYAQFCSRMLQYMTPEIKDETLPLDKHGNVNAGGTLFRKYLLNRCQQDFEAGWKAKLPEKPEGEKPEAAMLSDEYYVAAAAKRRGLGLVRFIGELFKLGMLTSRIMHMCVKRLVDWEGMPDEAEVESLTSLLKTIGENLDSEEKMRPTMDAYFDRIKSMINYEGLPSRLKFMLMDLVEMRRKGWKGKDSGTKGPTTIEEVRLQALAAEREKEAQRQAEGSRRGGGGGGGRMGLGRGDARNFSGGGQNMPPPDYQRNTVGMDELRRLGGGGRRQASSQGTMSFGPSSLLNAARGSNTRRTLAPRAGEESGNSSRTGTPPAGRDKKDKEEAAPSANAFSALAGLDSGEANDHPASPPSAPASTSAAKADASSQRQRSKSPLADGKADAKDAA